MLIVRLFKSMVVKNIFICRLVKYVSKNSSILCLLILIERYLSISSINSLLSLIKVICFNASLLNNL